jgi:integrase/recombinase XerD
MSVTVAFHSVLDERMHKYLTHKRAIGRRFHTEGNVLLLLDRYLVQEQISTVEQITPELLDAFLLSRPRKRPRSYNHLLSTIRGLFHWLVRQGLLDRLPLDAKPKRQTAERLPFIFDVVAARHLLEVAAGLPDNPRSPLRAMTYRTIFAILYGLGLRVGEVSRLLVRDVDVERQLLIIRESKFYKTRLVPFGPRMGALLTDFLRTRAQNSKEFSGNTTLFSFTENRAINPCTISQTFHRLVPQLRLVLKDGTAPPRLHCLRHSFAVGTLLRWYRTGMDPQDRLLQLSTFLGHVDPMSTAVYLRATYALLQEANLRFEKFAQPVFQEVAQ